MATNYPLDDVLGQAVLTARTAARTASEEVGALGQLLDAERESHRVEKLRLVERAESAERQAERFAAELAALKDAIRSAARSARRRGVAPQVAELMALADLPKIPS